MTERLLAKLFFDLVAHKSFEDMHSGGQVRWRWISYILEAPVRPEIVRRRCLLPPGVLSPGPKVDTYISCAPS
jgi:hypothetical protein